MKVYYFTNKNGDEVIIRAFGQKEAWDRLKQLTKRWAEFKLLDK